MADFPLGGSNLPTVLSNISAAASRVADTQEQLRSGLRINKVSDDPGGMAEATKLKLDSRIADTGVNNLTYAGRAVTTATEAANSLTDILSNLSDLAYTASNAVTTSAQRTALNQEAQNLITEYRRVVSSASFNSKNLIDGSISQFDYQAGNFQATLSAANFTQSLSNIDLSTQAKAVTAYTNTDLAISYTSIGISTLVGATERLSSAISQLGKQRDLNRFAVGRIEDADTAALEAQQNRDKIIQKSGQALIAQANLSAERVYSLLDDTGLGEGQVGPASADETLKQRKQRLKQNAKITKSGI